jgi:hypothetical protein
MEYDGKREINCVWIGGGDWHTREGFVDMCLFWLAMALMLHRHPLFSSFIFNRLEGGIRRFFSHPVWLLGGQWVFLHCSLMELELALHGSILLERQ